MCLFLVFSAVLLKKTVFQASSKLFFFVSQEIVLCLRCCLINATFQSVYKVEGFGEVTAVSYWQDQRLNNVCDLD